MPRLAREDDAMPANHAPLKGRTVSGILARAPRVLLVALALVWVGLLVALLPGAWPTPVQAGALVQAVFTDPPTATTAADTPTTVPTSTATNAPPTATATRGSTQSSGGAPQAPTPVTTRIDLSQPTLGTSASDTVSTFTPSNLASNGLAVFTTLGCIVGLIGLLAVAITWITLVSDGWGPMLKAVVRGNRRGKLRFTRKGADARGATRERTPVSAPRSRGGWR